jgi:hypothetical protein
LEALIYLEQSLVREHIMFLHPTKLVASCLLKRQPSLEADIASGFCNMMGNNPYRNAIMNPQLKLLVPVRSPPSMKASTMATRGITKDQGRGIKNWFKRGQLPLSSSVWEKKLLYSSASP